MIFVRSDWLFCHEADWDQRIIGVVSCMNEHFEHSQELFGEQWSDAIHVAEMFRQATGFILLDIHPGNIAFAD